MIFQLSIAGSTSIHEKNHLKVFLSRSIEELLLGMSTFFNPPALLQSVSCFIVGVESYSIKKPFVFFQVRSQHILRQLL